jgi:hypothetical protein
MVQVRMSSATDRGLTQDHRPSSAKEEPELIVAVEIVPVAAGGKASLWQRSGAHLLRIAAKGSMAHPMSPAC